MKLVLLLVVLIVAFTANCRDIHNGHQNEAKTFEEQVLPPVAVNRAFTDDEQYTQNGHKVVEEEMGIELRGKKDKKILKELVTKLESLDYKMSQELKSIREKQDNMTDTGTELKEELQSIMENITEGDLQLRMDLKALKEHQDNITDSNKNIKMDLEIIKEHQNNFTDSNADLKMKLQIIGDHQANITNTNKELKDELKSIMTNITDSDSQLKTDVSSMKQSLTNTNSGILSKLNSISVKRGGWVSTGCQGTDTFRVRQQCFKVFRDTRRKFDDAQSKCGSSHLILAEPTDDNAPLLRKYMVDRYGSLESWVGAKGDGSKFVWKSSGKALYTNSSLLDDNAMQTSYCLELDVLSGEWRAAPGKPYDGMPCTTTRWALCEVL